MSSEVRKGSQRFQSAVSPLNLQLPEGTGLRVVDRKCAQLC